MEKALCGGGSVFKHVFLFPVREVTRQEQRVAEVVPGLVCWQRLLKRCQAPALLLSGKEEDLPFRGDIV